MGYCNIQRTFRLKFRSITKDKQLSQKGIHSDFVEIISASLAGRQYLVAKVVPRLRRQLPGYSFSSLLHKKNYHEVMGRDILTPPSLMACLATPWFPRAICLIFDTAF